MDRRARWRVAGETFAWPMIFGFGIYLIVMVGPYLERGSVLFQPALIATLFLPMLIPVAAAAIAIALSDRWYRWPRVLMAGTITWIVYFAALVLWIVSIESSLAQGYAMILLLPWFFSWFLVPLGFAIAESRHQRSLLRR